MSSSSDKKRKSCSNRESSSKRNKSNSHLSQWDKRLEELVEYKEKNGDFFPSPQHNLYQWVSHQRMHKRMNNLSLDRVRKLTELVGEEWWDIKKKQNMCWIDKFNEIKDITDADELSWQQYNWIKYNRYEYNHRLMQSTRIPLFMSLSECIRDAYSKDELFKWMVELCKRVFISTGMKRIPSEYMLSLPEAEEMVGSEFPNPKYEQTHVTLGRWVRRQRELNKKDSLCEERVELLNSIAFFNDSEDNEWVKNLEKVRLWLEEHSNKYPTKHDNEQLRNWVQYQRRRKNKLKNMTESDQQRIETTLPNWAWSAQDASFNEKYNNLETFLRENDTYPSQSSKEKEEKALYRWYYDCKKKLSAWEKKKPERVTKMNKLPNWEWN